jgi:hypothetical protein
MDPIGHCNLPPLGPVLVEGEKEYEVEKVLNSCFCYGQLEFFVAWKGYGVEENSWVPECNLHVKDLVLDFYCCSPEAPHCICRFEIDFARSLMPRRGGDVRGQPFQSLNQCTSQKSHFKVLLQISAMKARFPCSLENKGPCR